MNWQMNKWVNCVSVLTSLQLGQKTLQLLWHVWIQLAYVSICNIKQITKFELLVNSCNLSEIEENNHTGNKATEFKICILHIPGNWKCFYNARIKHSAPNNMFLQHVDRPTGTDVMQFVTTGAQTLVLLLKVQYASAEIIIQHDGLHFETGSSTTTKHQSRNSYFMQTERWKWYR